MIGDARGDEDVEIFGDEEFGDPIVGVAHLAEVLREARAVFLGVRGRFEIHGDLREARRSAVRQKKREGVLFDREGRGDGDAPFGGLARENLFEGLVAVAREDAARAKTVQLRRAFARVERPVVSFALGAVDGKPVDFLVGRLIGEAVAVRKRHARERVDQKTLRIDAKHARDGVARVLGTFRLREVVGL